MTVVVDASVAIKWVIDEDGSLVARDLILRESLAAPELMFVECANVLRTKVRAGQLGSDLARRAMLDLDATPIRSVLVRPHAVTAHAIAVELQTSAYDALYLAVALAERARLITADRRFAQAAQSHPMYAGSIELLAS
jgi:predicted nucleic acid-binding protein